MSGTVPGWSCGGSLLTNCNWRELDCREGEYHCVENALFVVLLTRFRGAHIEKRRATLPRKAVKDVIHLVLFNDVGGQGSGGIALDWEPCDERGSVAGVIRVIGLREVDIFLVPERNGAGGLVTVRSGGFNELWGGRGGKGGRETRGQTVDTG